MYLSSLKLHNFRNYKELDISFNKPGALLIGENGAGKTNVIEAIYFLSLGRSIRGASKIDMIHAQSNEAFMQGVYTDSAQSLDQATISVGFSRDKKIVMKKDNQRVATLSELIIQSKVVFFGPQDIMLVYGEPAERRRFVDIVLSQIDKQYLTSLIEYKRNLINRNKLLAANTADRSIEIYEENMARYGADIFISRARLFDYIIPHFADYYSSITHTTNKASIRYKQSLHCESITCDMCRDQFLQQLQQRRKRDMALGFTTVGPHRDDFICYINEKEASAFGSQGECRIAVFSLKLCSLLYLEKNRQGNIIILVDDAFAELDHAGSVNIVPQILNRGQLFVTAISGRETLFTEIPRFSVKDDTITPV